MEKAADKCSEESLVSEVNVNLKSNGRCKTETDDRKKKNHEKCSLHNALYAHALASATFLFSIHLHFAEFMKKVILEGGSKIQSSPLKMYARENPAHAYMHELSHTFLFIAKTNKI